MFYKEEAKLSRKVWEYIILDKSWYSRFHKINYHNTKECIHLKDFIEDFIQLKKISRFATQ